MAHVDDGEFVTSDGVINEVRIPSDGQYANAGDVRFASKAGWRASKLAVARIARMMAVAALGLCFEM